MTSNEFTFFVWQLSDYSKHFDAEGGRLKSPVFGLSRNPRIKFCLHFYAKCPVEGYENFVSLGLGIERFGGRRVVELDFSIWIEGNGETVKRGATYVFDAACSHRARVLRSFCQRKSLDPKGKFIQNDVLTIYCRIRQETTDTLIEKPLIQLRKAFDSGVFSDFRVKVSGQTFNTHKFILAAHSDVFHAMLTNQATKEAKDCCLELEDTDPETVQAMLQYFYSGKLEEHGNREHRSREHGSQGLSSLYQLADKYQAESLMEACVEQMLDELNVESASNCLALAFQYNLQELKRQSIDFTIENYKKVLQSDSWKQLRAENPSLSAQIFDAILEESHVECSKIE